MRKFAITCSFFFLLLFSSVLSFHPTASASALEEAKVLVNDYYAGEVTSDMQNAQSLEELMSYLDVHSTAYTREEYEGFIQSVDHQTVGIGVVIEKHDKGVLISRVIKGSSAEAGGIVAGDIITAVDGVDISTATVSEASSKITGPNNTQVKLSILKSDGKVVQLTIIRKPFTVENVTSSLLYGNIGYIAFESFSSTVDREITNAYNDLKKLGATSFIVDVRNNGGGYVDAAEKVIGMFPSAKWAYKLIDNQGEAVYAANTNHRKRAIFPADTKLLVNGFSASASEMLAAALKDQQAAFLYGTTTYGKGTMQAFFEVAEGEYYIKLTIAEFQSPNGNKIDGVGIEPDTESNMPLQIAHFQSLSEKFTAYKKLSSMENVSASKTFNITFNKSVTSDLDYNAIELVELGGNKIETRIFKDGNKLKVKPVKNLAAGGHYMLVIHPTVKSKHNQMLKNGAYLYITVEN